MSGCRKKFPVAVLVVVKHDVVHTGLVQEFISVIHFHAERLENLLRSRSLGHDGIVALFLSISGIRKYGQIMMKKV